MQRWQWITGAIVPAALIMLLALLVVMQEAPRPRYNAAHAAPAMQMSVSPKKVYGGYYPSILTPADNAPSYPVAADDLSLLERAARRLKKSDAPNRGREWMR